MGEEILPGDLERIGLELLPTGEAVDTAAVMDEVRRACGDLPSSVQGKIYAERVFEARYGPHTDNEPDRPDD